jgi:hypothetical protein
MTMLTRHIENLKQSVDNVVIVLTGQPRATSLPQWKSMVSDYYRSVVETYNEDTGEWTRNTGNTPNVDVILVLNEKDTPDGSLRGLDLDHDHLMPLGPSITKSILKYRLFNERFDFKVNKEKWEKYQSECWEWADSINFVYWDHTEATRRVDKMINKHNFIPTYETQYWHFNIAYNQRTDIFDKLTKNSVVVRQRYDSVPCKDLPIWEKIAKLINYKFCDPETSHLMPVPGMDKSPLALMGQFIILRGKLFSSDFASMFDGPGAVLFGKHFMDWCFDGMFTDKKWNETDPSEWYVAETLIPKFCQEYNYSIDQIFHSQADQLFRFLEIPMYDKWREHWYDDWTPELVQEIQQYFLKENKVT